MRKIELLIVVIILLALAALVGCKDTDNWFTDNWFNTTDLNEPQKVSLDFIPTWPDYIELEKDLIIGHTKFTNPNGSIGDAYGIVLEKGTKIYFKE